MRLGALLPRGGGAQSRVRNALARASRAAAAVLPYNLSLEVLPGAPLYRDPASLARWLCQALVVRGVAAVLAFPASRRELLQVDFAAAFLDIPFISIRQEPEEQEGDPGDDVDEPPMPFRTWVSLLRPSFSRASTARGRLSSRAAAVEKRAEQGKAVVPFEGCWEPPCAGTVYLRGGRFLGRGDGAVSDCCGPLVDSCGALLL